MIEKIVFNYLSNVLDVPVYVGEKPTNKQNEYVVLRVLDKGFNNHIKDASIYFESFSTSLFKAAELNKKVEEAMFNIITIDEVSASKYGGGGQNIDVNTKTYAYECVFNIYY